MIKCQQCIVEIVLVFQNRPKGNTTMYVRKKCLVLLSRTFTHFCWEIRHLSTKTRNFLETEIGKSRITDEVYHEKS